MKNWCVQVIVILLISTVAALVVNASGDGGIALKGNWPSRTAQSGEAVAPPSADEGDPLFITLDDAVARYQSSEVVFIDARDPEDYAYGHVTRSINIPFDYLDESWDPVIDALDRNVEYVIYCSGTECEVSLFLGRYFTIQLGFTNVSIFYGGWSEWEGNNLPMAGEAFEDNGGDR